MTDEFIRGVVALAQNDAAQLIGGGLIFGYFMGLLSLMFGKES